MTAKCLDVQRRRNERDTAMTTEELKHGDTVRVPVIDELAIVITWQEYIDKKPHMSKSIPSLEMDGFIPIRWCSTNNVTVWGKEFLTKVE